LTDFDLQRTGAGLGLLLRNTAAALGLALMWALATGGAQVTTRREIGTATG
jgi:hypothetical protein